MVRIVVLVLIVSACSAGTDQGVSEVSAPTSTHTAISTSSTPSVVASSAPRRPAICDAFLEPVAIGAITDPTLTEVSGIAVGSNGVIWAHNDSGAEPALWALDRSGAVLGSLEVGTRNIDWEDMAVGSGPNGQVFLYLADIGDNLTGRSSVVIHRFEEPVALDGAVSELESLTVRYPTGAADAEAFFVDPESGDSFIVTKTPTGRALVLRVPVGAWSDPSVEAEHVATVDLGALSFVTAGAISRNGTIIALRTYRGIWLWERVSGEPVADAMRAAPCEAPSADEPQGEALAFDGDDLLTVSEGRGAVIYRIGR